MTAENPVKQLTQEELDALPAPQTRGELKAMVASTLDDVLKIPTNLTFLGQAILGQVARDLADLNRLRQRQQRRPVFVKVYYPGAIRCTILPRQEGESEDQLLSVLFEEKNGEAGETTGDVWVQKDMPEVYTKLVLSQSAQPNDVFFLTTSEAIDRAMEEATDLALSQAGLEQAPQGDEPVVEGDDQAPTTH